MPLPLLLLLLWLRNATSGLPADTMYTRVQHLEGETLSVQCHYNHHKNQGDGKVWCKIKKNKCDTKFTRAWAQKPHYLLQDDAQAKVVTITMVALRRQDSGRYWCMRNSSKTLYPVMGIQLEVSPGMHQDFDPTVFTAVVASLPVPVLLVIFYGLWKRRHVGPRVKMTMRVPCKGGGEAGYSVYDGHARPWRDTPRPEPPWKLTWSETT
ncbi:trem-like transcript 2 protein [Rhynchocyon petersi]